MLRGNWGIIATAVGCLGLATLALNSAYEQQQQTIATNTYGKHGNKPPQQYAFPRSGIPATIESAISNPQPTRGQDHEKRDLAAQEASSTFAWWMVIISFLGFCVTTLATLLLYQQIRLTREAVEDTGRATAAMREGNIIAQNASRAWVVCEDIILKKPVEYRTVSGLGDRYEITSDVIIKNVGAGLAKDFRIHIDIVSMKTIFFEPAWTNIKQRTKERFKVNATPNRVLGMPIAPSQIIKQRFGWGGPIEGHPSIDQVANGAFYLIGYLEYRDHFGREQNARFAFHPDGDSVNPWDQKTLVRAGNMGDAT